MVDDESNEIPTPAEQPAEAEPVEPKKTPAEQKAELKSQMMGLVTLLVVFGLLWGLVKVMPSMAEKLGKGFSSWSSSGDESAEPAAVDEKADAEIEGDSKASIESTPTVAKLKDEPKEIVEPAPEEKAITTQPVISEALSGNAASSDDGRISDEKAMAQILEAIGGAERGEVRHVAFNGDSSKMIASLKMTPDSGDAKLIEVIFERDDFGRYISVESPELDSPITIWK